MAQSATSADLSDTRAETADNLRVVIDALERVNWSDVSEVDTADVARWSQKLEYARKVEQRDAAE